MKRNFKQDFFGKNIDFIYKSMDNLWETIKICDIKVSFILVILCMPISKVNRIIDIFLNLLSKDFCLVISFLLLFSFILLWFFGFFIAFRALFATIDPSRHIRGEKPVNIFFPVNNWNISLFDIIVKVNVKSRDTILDQINLLPTNRDQLIEQLIFEQQKLAFITRVKAARANLLYKISFLWLIVGLLIIILERFC